jgi:hypothetical protein
VEVKSSLEDREVQGESETDGVGRGQLSHGDIGSGLVSLERLVGRSVSLVAGGELGEVSVVVTHPVSKVPSAQGTFDVDQRNERHDSHLVVEDLGLSGLGGGDQVLVQDGEDVLTDLGELGLDLLPVSLDHRNLGLVALGLLLLLDGGDDSPRSTSSTDDVLVSDGKEVSLLDGELLVGGGNRLHILDHLCDRQEQLSAENCD